MSSSHFVARMALVVGSGLPLAAAGGLATRPAGAQEIGAEPGAAAVDYGNSRWALQSPDRDWAAACAVGFLTFQFRENGYFTYNNRVGGSWRANEQGHILLRTRDGVSLMLVVNGQTLRPTRDTTFVRRFNQFQRCAASE